MPVKVGAQPLSPYWPRFIEKLLLAIIDAHPNDKDEDPARDRQERLRMALKALLGESKRGNSEQYDLPALMRMAAEKMTSDATRASESYLDISSNERLVTVREIASKYGRDRRNTAEGSAEERLRRKFRDPKIQAYLWAALNDALPEEQQMRDDLLAVQRILDRWGTRLELDFVLLALASEWGAKRLS